MRKNFKLYVELIAVNMVLILMISFMLWCAVNDCSCTCGGVREEFWADTGSNICPIPLECGSGNFIVILIGFTIVWFSIIIIGIVIFSFLNWILEKIDGDMKDEE